MTALAQIGVAVWGLGCFYRGKVRSTMFENGAALLRVGFGLLPGEATSWRSNFLTHLHTYNVKCVARSG
jgi:hypothetical protein